MEHGEKIDVLCENCGLTIDELHEYVHKYPINKNEYYFLRGAIRNYLERKENADKDKTNTRLSIAPAKNLRVKLSNDMIVHRILARIVNENQEQEDDEQNKKTNNRKNNVTNVDDFSLDRLSEDDDDFDLHSLLKEDDNDYE